MITGLNHINLRAQRALLDTLRDFYCDVLGLKEGARPDFNFNGYWLYAGSQAVLHLSLQADDEAPRLPSQERGVLDHTAFYATDPEGTATLLRAHGVEFRESRSTRTWQHQFFFPDPAGNLIELNFPLEAGAC
jgi:catechol 2,3-dioxygenase-like lactoylglutathione lyase family enzyme